VLVVDDHPPIREWVSDVLAPLGISVLPARSGDEAIALLREGAHVDAAICDVLMPHAEIEGVETARILWHDYGIPCLMLTSAQEAGARLAALYAGAMGYVLKELASADLIRASVTSLLTGADLPNALTTISISDAEARQIDERQAAYVRAIEQLTPQQRVVAQLLQEGKTNREIAEQLVLSRGTVNTHVSHILERLNLATRREVKTRVLFTYKGRGVEVNRRSE
jgi:RNA polymerase sigma factor (sigma-70 family)